MAVRSWLLVGLLVVVVAGVVVAKRVLRAPAPSVVAEPSAPPAELEMAASGIPTKTLLAPQLPATLGNGKPTLVDFGAAECQQCRREAAVLDRAVVRYQGKANLLFIDTSRYASIARQYGVRLIPTQIVFDAEGKEVSRHIGFHPLEAIAADLAKAGVKE